jgi:hypothetical protein
VDVKVKLHALTLAVNDSERSVSRPSCGNRPGDTHSFVGLQKSSICGDKDMYLSSLEGFKSNSWSVTVLSYHRSQF